MHRTDASDFAPDIGGGQRGFKGTPPGNETILASAFMNAVQEEIAQVILDAGFSLRASSGDDTAAQWNQLSPAISSLIAQKGVIANATAFGMDTGAIGTINTQAINDAFATSNIVYIPGGSYTIDVAPIIPNGGVLLGDYGLTFLTSDSGAFWDLTGKSTTIQGITFISGVGFANQLILGHGVERRTFLDRCTFTGSVFYSLLFNPTVTDGEGEIFISECFFSNPLAFDFVVGVGSSKIHFTKCFFENAGLHFNNILTIATRQFTECTFDGSTIEATGDNVHIKTSVFKNANTFNFNGACTWLIYDNILETTPAVNIAGVGNRFRFINNRNEFSQTLIADEFINGAKTSSGLTGNVIIGNGVSQVILWNSLFDQRMAFHPSYSEDDIYNGGTGVFTSFGLGNGSTKIIAQVFVAQSGSSDVFVTLRIDGVNAYIFSKTIANGGGDTVHNLTVDLNLNSGQFFDIFIENLSGGSATLLVNNGGPMNTFIDVEGL